MLMVIAQKVYLFKLWDSETIKVVVTHQKKTRKHRAIVKKIEEIDKLKVEKILNDYYYMCTIKYITAFKKWIRSTKLNKKISTSNITPFKNTKSKLEKTSSARNIFNRRLTNNAIHSPVLGKLTKQSSKILPVERPKFEYKPSEATIRKIILDTAEGK